MRIGVMGGTFDPPHLGHLIVASEAYSRLALDLVLFVPAGQPWQKSDRVVTPSLERLAMTALAVADDPRFAVSRVDVDRPGPTYTVDTLTDLKAGLDPSDELFLLVGADALQGIGTWQRSAELAGLAHIVGLTRPGHALTAPSTWEGQVSLLQVPEIEISSTDCRERFSADLPMKYFVPDSVIDYAVSRALYRGAR